MKRIILLLACALIAVPGFAQRDIKTLDKIGRDAIITLIGQPDGKDYWGGVIDGDALQYPDTYINLDETTAELLGFNTNSSSFCVLSDYVSGGFKVGDSFDKLKSFDFVHTKYGKNREGNKLKLIDSSAERDYYEAFGKEKKRFYFAVKNGIITGVDFVVLDDDIATYYHCDMNNSPW